MPIWRKEKKIEISHVTVWTSIITVIFLFSLCYNVAVGNCYGQETPPVSGDVIDIPHAVARNPRLHTIDSIEKFLDFVRGSERKLSLSAKRVVDDFVNRIDPKDKLALRFNCISVPETSEIFTIIPPLGSSPVRVYRITHHAKWQILMLVNSDANDSAYLEFALKQGLHYAVYLARSEFIKQRFPQTHIFPLSSGAFLCLGQFYYTIAIASAQYVSSFDALMIDVVGWLTSSFPTGSRIRLLREVLPHEDSHMRFLRLSREDQDTVIRSILSELGEARIEQIYNVIGFWHEQNNPDYFTASEEMITHPEWFFMDDISMPGAKKAWVLKLSSGKYLNLTVFITEFLSTLNMNLTSLMHTYGVPLEFINRLKALYDERQGIGFNLYKELSVKTRDLLHRLKLIDGDISEYLSIISMQYPYLILEECWKGYFTDYDLEEIIGLSYAKKLLAQNGFDTYSVDMIKPIIIKYSLVLTYQGAPIAVLEKIPTLSQWLILLLSHAYQGDSQDKAIDEIIYGLQKISLSNIHLIHNIPISILIAATKEEYAERTKLIREIMGELNTIGIVERLTKGAKDSANPNMLSRTLLAKYICTVTQEGLISLRLALEEHIEKALIEKGNLAIELDVATLLGLDRQGKPILKDVYFMDAVNLLRTITKNNITIRLINCSDSLDNDTLRSVLKLDRFEGIFEIVHTDKENFTFSKESIKIAHEKNIDEFIDGYDVAVKGKMIYFEGEEFEIISAFDVFLSGIVMLCSKDKNFLKFLDEFLDTLPNGYKVFDEEHNLLKITLPSMPEELITKEYLKKLKEKTMP
ncbi:MAG: hypothetical protein V1893_01345 [Candidatus Omnitrophota bacterium]